MMIGAFVVVQAAVSCAYILDCYKEMALEVMVGGYFPLDRFPSRLRLDPVSPPGAVVVRNTMSFAMGYAVAPWFAGMGIQNGASGRGPTDALNCPKGPPKSSLTTCFALQPTSLWALLGSLSSSRFCLLFGTSLRPLHRLLLFASLCRHLITESGADQLFVYRKGKQWRAQSKDAYWKMVATCPISH